MYLLESTRHITVAAGISCDTLSGELMNAALGALVAQSLSLELETGIIVVDTATGLLHSQLEGIHARVDNQGPPLGCACDY